MTSSFDATTRNPLAFNWLLDVQGEDKSKEWASRFALKDLQRALLSKHYHDLLWEEAIIHLLDVVPPDRGGEWMRTLKLIDPADFTGRMRSEADQIYSHLSKSVHYEFVVQPDTQFDRATVIDLMARTWELLGRLALAAAHSTALVAQPSSEALELFELAQEELSL